MSKDYSKYYIKFNPTEGEEILLVIKESLTAHFSKIVIGLVLILLPFFLMFYLISQGPIGVSIFAGLVILSVVYIIREFYIWNNTVFIITTQRIIDIEQNGLLHRTVSEIAHSKIQDISYQSKGLMQMIHGTGTIQIKTSVPDLKIAMFNVPKVKLHCSLINESVAEHHQKNGQPLNSQQKMENFGDFLDQDELAKYSEMNLKDLIEEYVSIYSRNRLKKTLYDEIHKDEDENS